MCGLISQPGVIPPPSSCTTDTTDIACCSPGASEDCVYDGFCYSDDLNPELVQKTVNNIDLHCSLKHWCPVDFAWQGPPTNACIFVGENFCYTGINPGSSYCANPYVIPLNPLCLRFGPINTPPETLPYESSCCYDFTLFTFYYYSWAPVTVYGNPSGSGFGSGE